MNKDLIDKMDPLLYFWTEQRRHYRLAKKHLLELEKECAAYMLNDDISVQTMNVQMEMVGLGITIVKILNALQKRYPERFPKEFNAGEFWNAKA